MFNFSLNKVKTLISHLNKIAETPPITPKKKGIIKKGKRWFPNPKGKLCPDVWPFSSQRHKEKINGKVQKLQHITPKPLDMIERIIKEMFFFLFYKVEKFYLRHQD
jgi:hypothetical protein